MCFGFTKVHLIVSKDCTKRHVINYQANDFKMKEGEYCHANLKLFHVNCTSGLRKIDRQHIRLPLVNI